MPEELEGCGWTIVEPPEEEDGESVIARYNGKPIKAGILMDVVKDNQSEFQAKYRSGQYDVEIKIGFDIGRGQVKVEKAEGYTDEN